MRFTEANVLAALAARYPKPAWAFLPQVRNGTGWTRNERYADALAFSLWPSRGLELHGFEIKVSRSDWQRELADPAKADTFSRHADRWWVVAPEGVVLPGELPATWGYVVATLRGDKVVLATRTNAPITPDVDRLPKSFVASVLRAAQRDDPAEAEIAARVYRAVAEQREANEKTFAARVEGMKQSHAAEVSQLRSTIQRFENAAGVRLSDYPWNGTSAESIGALVKALVQGRLEEKRRELENLYLTTQHLAETTRKAMEAFHAAETARTMEATT